jgi:UDP-N-acetylglucosamine--N-acetylmuramyl-(pentapeptide) pyrophosphoryl-undecaprenol N-acetylglucosamine transferase
MADAGAAVMLLQKDATEESLENALADLLLDAPRRAQMAQRAQSLARPGALEHIAAIVLSLAGRA